MAGVTNTGQFSLSGKADGLVYVRFNGEFIPVNFPSKKKEAWTPGMLQNLERFKRINAFCALFKDSLISQIWNGMNPKMSGYALFLKLIRQRSVRMVVFLF